MKPSFALETNWGAILRAFCLGLVLLGVLPSLRAQQLGLLTYEKVGNAVQIIGYPKDAVGAVEIPAVIDGLPVIDIRGQVFSGCTGLTRVTLPSSLTSITANLFHGCTGLTDIGVQAGNPVFASEGGLLFDATRTRLLMCPPGRVGHYSVPAGVTAIGESAFHYCTGLTRVGIPSTLTRIPPNLFLGCTGLTDINVEAGNPAFASVDGVLLDGTRTRLLICPPGRVGHYSIPASVTAIGESAFRDCTGLTRVGIHSTLTSIPGLPFYGCTALTAVNVEAGNPAYSSDDGVLLNAARTVLLACPAGKAGACTIPSTVTELAFGALYGCVSLTDINVEAGNPTFASESGVLLDAARMRLIRCPEGRGGHFSIPPSVTGIDFAAFAGCVRLTSVTIPSSVTAIGEAAFSGCSGLTRVVIPSSVTHISRHAFSWCTGLTSVTLPSTLRHVGYSAFFNCYLLTHIELKSGDPVVDGNTMSIPLPAVTEGLQCQVETSTDLIHWTPTDVTLSVPGPEGLRSASVPIDGPQRFMRVVVSVMDDPMAGV